MVTMIATSSTGWSIASLNWIAANWSAIGNYTRYLEQSAEHHERLAEMEDRRRLLRRELRVAPSQPSACYQAEGAASSG